MSKRKIEPDVSSTDWGEFFSILAAIGIVALITYSIWFAATNN